MMLMIEIEDEFQPIVKGKQRRDYLAAERDFGDDKSYQFMGAEKLGSGPVIGKGKWKISPNNENTEMCFRILVVKSGHEPPY